MPANQEELDRITQEVLSGIGEPAPTAPRRLPGVEEADPSPDPAQYWAVETELDQVTQDILRGLGTAAPKAAIPPGYDEPPKPMVPQEVRRGSRSKISDLDDQEALRYLPKTLSETPPPELLEDVDWESDPEGFSRAHRKMVREYGRARTTEDKAEIMRSFTEEWNPDILKRSEEKTGVFMKTLTGLARVVEWVDSWSGRPQRGTIKSLWQSRKRDLEGGGAFNVEEMDRAISENYKNSDGSFDDGEETLKNAVKYLSVVGGQPLAWAHQEASGQDFTEANWVGSVDEGIDKMFDFGADAIQWATWTGMGVLDQALPFVGDNYKGWAEAREKHIEEGSSFGHGTLGFLGLVLTDPLSFLKIGRAFDLAGAKVTESADHLIKDVASYKIAARAKELRKGGKYADEAGEIDEARILQDAEEAVVSDVNYSVIDAANASYIKGGDVHGWGPVELLKQWRGTVESTDPAYWKAKFPDRSDEWAKEAAGEFVMDKPNMAAIESIGKHLNVTFKTNATPTDRIEEVWSALNKESNRQKRLYDIEVKLTGEVDPETGVEAIKTFIHWIDPREALDVNGNMTFRLNRGVTTAKPDLATKLGRAAGKALTKRPPKTAAAAEAAEEAARAAAYKQTKVFAKGDNRRVRWGFAAMKHAKMGGLDRSRMVLESIVGLEKAQPYFSKVAGEWQPMQPMHAAMWRRVERGELRDQAERTLDRQRLANHIAKIEGIVDTTTPEGNDVLKLAMAYKELGKHIPATEANIELAAWFSKTQKLLDNVEKGITDDLPPEVAKLLEEAIGAIEQADVFKNLGGDLRKAYEKTGPERKEALKTFKAQLTDASWLLKKILVDDFRVKAEMEAVAGLSSNVDKLKILRKARADLDKMATKENFSEAGSLDALLRQLRQIKKIQDEGIDAIREGVPEMARTEAEFLQRMRTRGLIPEGSHRDWNAHKGHLRFRVRDALRATGVDDWEAQADGVMATMSARAEAWSSWHNLPKDHADAWFTKYSKDIEEEVLGRAVEVAPISSAAKRIDDTLETAEGKRVLSEMRVAAKSPEMGTAYAKLAASRANAWAAASGRPAEEFLARIHVRTAKDPDEVFGKLIREIDPDLKPREIIGGTGKRSDPAEKGGLPWQWSFATPSEIDDFMNLLGGEYREDYIRKVAAIKKAAKKEEAGTKGKAAEGRAAEGYAPEVWIDPTERAVHDAKVAAYRTARDASEEAERRHTVWSKAVREARKARRSGSKLEELSGVAAYNKGRTWSDKLRFTVRRVDGSKRLVLVRLGDLGKDLDELLSKDWAELGLKRSKDPTTKTKAWREAEARFWRLDEAADAARHGYESVVMDLWRAAMNPESLGSVSGAARGARTDTPEFRAWFGGSKVVDEAGEPLRVYHGTGADFEAFETRGRGGRTVYGEGAYFSEFADEASQYATVRSDLREPIPGAAPNVVPVYLNIKNPFIRGVSRPGDAAKAVIRGHLERQGKANRLIDEYYIRGKMESFSTGMDTLEEVIPPGVLTDALIADGFDGVKAGRQWVAFKPTQIKSTQNVGAWSPDDPRILKTTNGLIVFGEQEKALIFLFESARPGTLGHELGHFFRRDLPQELQDRAAQWAESASGIGKVGDKWSIGMEEAFAEAFELYLKTGVAPAASGMAGVFAKFKEWLEQIMTPLIASGKLKNVDDEIRQIFDEMFDAGTIKGGTGDAAARAADDGRQIISSFQSQTFQGMIKGVGGIFAKDLPKKDYDIASDWIQRELGEAGFKKNGEWSKAGQSMWAQAFANWTKSGRVSNHGLREVFAKFKDWIFKMYRAVSGQKEFKFKISPEVEEIFDRLLTKDSHYATHPMVREFDVAYRNYMTSYGGNISVLGKAVLNEVLSSMMEAAKYSPAKVRWVHDKLFSKDKMESVEAWKFINEEVSERLSGRFNPPRGKFQIKAPEFKNNKAQFKAAISGALQENAGLTAEEAADMVRLAEFDDIVTSAIPAGRFTYNQGRNNFQEIVLAFAKRFVALNPDKAPVYPRMVYKVPGRAAIDAKNNLREAQAAWKQRRPRVDVDDELRFDYEKLRIDYYKAASQVLKMAGRPDADTLARKILSQDLTPSDKIGEEVLGRAVEVAPVSPAAIELKKALDEAVERLSIPVDKRRADAEGRIKSYEIAIKDTEGKIKAAEEELAGIRAGKPAVAKEVAEEAEAEFKRWFGDSDVAHVRGIAEPTLKHPTPVTQAEWNKLPKEERHTKVSSVYVQAEGGLFKLTRKQLEQVAEGEDWLDVGKMLVKTARVSDNKWKNLPASVWADDTGRLSSGKAGVEVVGMDDIDIDYAKAILEQHLYRRYPHDAPKAPAAAEALSEYELKVIERGWHPGAWTDKASKEAFKTYDFLSTISNPQGASRQKISAAKKAITKRLAERGYKYEDILDSAGMIDEQVAADILDIGTGWSWMQGGDLIAPEWLSAMEKKAKILGVDLPSRGDRGTTAEAVAEAIIKAVDEAKPAAAPKPVDIPDDISRQAARYQQTRNIDPHDDLVGDFAYLSPDKPAIVIKRIKRVVEDKLKRDHGISEGAAKRLIKDEGSDWSASSRGDKASSVARNVLRDPVEWVSERVEELRRSARPDDYRFNVKAVEDFIQGRGGVLPDVARAAVKARVAIDEATETLQRLQESRAALIEELKAMDITPDEASLAEAAEVSAKRAPVSEEAMENARAQLKWLEKEIAEEEALIYGVRKDARVKADAMSKAAFEEELAPLAKYEVGEGGRRKRVLTGRGEDEITGSVERIQRKIAEGLTKGQPGKMKDAADLPSVVPKQLTKSMKKRIEALPGAQEEMLDIARKLKWDTTDPGEIWERIVNYNKKAKSYGDLAEEKRNAAMAAVRDSDRLRAFDAMPETEKTVVYNIVKDPRKYSVPPGASKKVRGMAESLGMTSRGKNDIFIHLHGEHITRRYGPDVRVKKVKVGDHFTDEEMEQALAVATLMDDFLEDKLKKLQNHGRLAKYRDKKIGAKIDLIGRKINGREDLSPGETKDSLLKQRDELRKKEFRPWTKEEFLRRVNVASYIPHMMRIATQRKIDALKGRFLPANYKISFERMRTRASILDDLNEQARDELAEDMLYHDVTSLMSNGPEFQSVFHEYDEAGNMIGGKSPEELSAIYDAAQSLQLREHFSPDEWSALINKKRTQAELDSVYEFFEADYFTLIKRYSESVDSSIANQVFLEDQLQMFPMGKEMGRDSRFVNNPDLAKEFGYVRLGKRDHIEAVGMMKLPDELTPNIENWVNQQLMDGASIPEVMAGLRRKGVNVPRNYVELHRSMPDVFVPEPVAEYLKWLRTPEQHKGAWGALVNLADGFHALAKTMATVSSLAHVGMNYTGNYASVAQKIGVDLFNPRHHYNMWLMMGSDAFPQLESKVITIGAHKKTIGELKRQFGSYGIDESPRTQAFLEEALGRGDVSAAKAPLGPMLLGSGLGATGGWIAGSAVAGPLGGAAGGVLGSWVGALGGEVLGKSWKTAIDPKTKKLAVGPMSKRELDVGRGARAVYKTEIGKFVEAIESAKKGRLKDLVQATGERVVGAGAGAAIATALGGPGVAAVAAAIGKASFPSYIKMMSALNQNVEIQARRLLGLAELSRGKTLDDVAFGVQDTMRNYSHLTPFERNILRRLFFFYTWDAGNVRFQLRQMVKNPRQAGIFNQFMNGVYNGQFTESEIQSLPEYLRWKAIVRTGGAKIFSVSGLPQQAAIELSRGFGTHGGKPIGLFARGRPDVLLLLELMLGNQSLYYGKGWEKLDNVRQMKNAPPMLKWFVGFPSKPVEVPVYKKGRVVGTRLDYRSNNPERYYMVSRLPGWRVMNEYMKLVQDTFIARALDAGDPSARATTEERMLAFSIGLKPYYVDFESQREAMAWMLDEALKTEWDRVNKNFVRKQSYLNRTLDYGRGKLLYPGEPVDSEQGD